MMTNSLQSIFQAIAQAQDEQDLRSHVMDRIGNYFAADRFSNGAIACISRRQLIECLADE
ncbi:hypothetical protein VB735_16210 [Halotia wernerae UHCC 0503]|nr:hypothetical protein [Halotia wernerae UHCC 0503]